MSRSNPQKPAIRKTSAKLRAPNPERLRARRSNGASARPASATSGRTTGGSKSGADAAGSNGEQRATQKRGGPAASSKAAAAKNTRRTGNAAARPRATASSNGRAASTTAAPAKKRGQKSAAPAKRAKTTPAPAKRPRLRVVNGAAGAPPDSASRGNRRKPSAKLQSLPPSDPASVAYESEVLSVLVSEPPKGRVKDADAAIRRRLREKKLGEYDRARIEALRAFKTELVEEIEKHEASSYYLSSHGLYASPEDFDHARLAADYAEKYPMISHEAVAAFIPIAVYWYYLR